MPLPSRYLHAVRPDLPGVPVPWGGDAAPAARAGAPRGPGGAGVGGPLQVCPVATGRRACLQTRVSAEVCVWLYTVPRGCICASVIDVRQVDIRVRLCLRLRVWVSASACVGGSVCVSVYF